jgi:RNA polymerase sigma-70 factor (ECF subfamily)
MRSAARRHSIDMMAVARAESVVVETDGLDVTDVYAANADFVWATLHRLGVVEADLPDVFQEVFVVVHRRRSSFDASSKITTWLFGICVRCVKGWRRRAHRRREVASETPDQASSESPEADASRGQARVRLARVLDALDPERRVVFVMYELEELSTDEIARILDIPRGTVHSRLFHARREFEKAVQRLEARERRGGAR